MITAGLVCPNTLYEAEQLKKEHEQFQVAIEVSGSVFSPRCFSLCFVIRKLTKLHCK